MADTKRKPEELLALAGLRIICIIVLTDELNQAVYRVYTSDGGYIEYTGFRAVPDWVKDWMKERNTWENVIPSCMFISGVSFNG